MFNNFEAHILSCRALDKFSECQDHMSFHVQRWLYISNGWLDIPSKKEAKKKERKKKGGKKEGKKRGRKERKKKGKKEKRKVKSTKIKGKKEGGRR